MAKGGAQSHLLQLPKTRRVMLAYIVAVLNHSEDLMILEVVSVYPF